MNDATEPNELTPAQRNEHYGKLNARFDAREKFLIEMGFKREAIPLLNIAVYTRMKYGKPLAVCACLLSCADEIVWADKVDEIKRFCA
jgi:hypothetical protein